MSQREAFDKWHKIAFGFCNEWVEALQSYEDLAIDCAWDSWQAAIAHAVPRWIPVSERLPTERGIKYMTVNFLRDVGVAYGGEIIDMNKSSDIANEERYYTHWMPRPAAPVEAQVEPNR